MHIQSHFFLLITFLIFSLETTMAQQLAFPGAEGFGKYTTGGRGGEVYHVTNLNDSGAGSFRDAVSRPNRYVVFDIGGVIKIESVVVVEDHITIAGQTAPGGGITIYGNRVAFNGNSGNNVTRYMRFRMGRYNGQKSVDALSISDNKDNYMFDHVSVSWGRDGTFDINTDSENITLQDCIIGQGLQRDNHSTGALIQGENLSISIIRTLWIDNKTRNPKIRGTHEFINSVLYNWQTNGYIMGDTEGISECNLIGNYFIYGPSSTGSHITRTTPTFNIYETDNWVDNNKDGDLNGSQITDYLTATIVNTPYNYPGVNQVLNAEEAVTHIINDAGSSLKRDAVDELLINELKSFGTEGAIIYGEEDNNIPNHVGVVDGGTTSQDSDGDGMPDAFEEVIGYDKNKSDYLEDADGDGYPNIEEYFNCLVGDCDVFYGSSKINGTYTVQFTETGTCMSQKGESIVAEACGTTSNFGWSVFEVDADQYLIQSVKDDAFVIFESASDGSIATTVQNQNSASRFQISVTEDQEYALKLYDTDLYVQVSNSGSSVVLGTSESLVSLKSFVPVKDCAGVIDGSAEIDACGVCSGGNTDIEPCTDGINGEDFCAGDGVFEDTNDGFLGTGYFNFENVTGSAALYKIYSNSSQSVNFTFRYANGGSASRPLSVSINGTEAINQLEFPVTGAWTTWSEVETTLKLEAGVNEIKLIATMSDGGPNIDLMGFDADGLYNINCDEEFALDCYGVPDGEAFIDECDECVGGETGKNACVEILGFDVETIKIYPNPVTDRLNIDSKEPYEMTITDLSGKVIYQSQGLVNKETVNLNNPGIYVVRILQVGKTLTKKVVVK